MSDTEQYLALLEELEREFPRFRIVPKSRSTLSRVIDVLLRIVTFNQMKSYLTGYYTTLGSAVYVIDSWDAASERERILILRHERVHMRQFRRFSPLIFAIFYVFLPLPFGLAYFRARFEQEAYAETIRASAALHGRAYVENPAFRERIVSQFTGPGYGWMWPFRRSLNRWYDRVLEEIS